jgi:hypothetical protein
LANFCHLLNAFWELFWQNLPYFEGNCHILKENFNEPLGFMKELIGKLMVSSAVLQTQFFCHFENHNYRSKWLFDLFRTAGGQEDIYTQFSFLCLKKREPPSTG